MLLLFVNWLFASRILWFRSSSTVFWIFRVRSQARLRSSTGSSIFRQQACLLIDLRILRTNPLGSSCTPVDSCFSILLRTSSSCRSSALLLQLLLLLRSTNLFPIARSFDLVRSSTAPILPFPGLSTQFLLLRSTDLFRRSP